MDERLPTLERYLVRLKLCLTLLVGVLFLFLALALAACQPVQDIPTATAIQPTPTAIPPVPTATRRPGPTDDLTLTHTARLETALEDATRERDAALLALENARRDVASLSAANAKVLTNGAELETRLADAQEEYRVLAVQLEEARARYRELEAAGGTLRGLDQSVQERQEEIQKLLERRAPLILGLALARTGRFKCTGSMEPTLSCLDEATWLRDFYPEDIQVGAIISFDPGCHEDQPDGVGTAHRVLKVREQDGLYHYWPKGDGAEEPDGCWIPETQVSGYLIEVQRGVHPENAGLRDSVMSAVKTYRDARDAHQTVREQYCPDSTECQVTKGVHAELDPLYEVQIQAYDTMVCWLENALRSKDPGDIPHECEPA